MTTRLKPTAPPHDKAMKTVVDVPNARPRLTMQVTRLWHSVEKFAALVAVLFSIPAIVLSFLSWSASRQAVDLAEQDFVSARTLILRADYNAEKGTFHWMPLGDGVTLQTCTITFPSSLGVPRWSVLAPDFELPTLVLNAALQKAIQGAISPPPKNSSLVSLQTVLPVLVESTYLAKGELRHVRSCYDLTFWLTVSDNPVTAPQIDFKSALFMGHEAKASE